MKKSGFTLAEVLITLGIVGVIAAMTIPTLIGGSQRQAQASKLSATITSLEDAFTSMMTLQDAIDFTETKFYEKVFSNEDEALGELTEYLKVGGKVLDQPAYTTISGTSATISPDFAFIMKNGAYVYITDDAQYVGVLVIDTNGKTKPNKYGRDVFFFKLEVNGRLIPYGHYDVELVDGSYPCTDDDKGDGEGCTARLINNGFKMDY